MKVKEGKTGTLYLTAYKNEDEVNHKGIRYRHRNESGTDR